MEGEVIKAILYNRDGTVDYVLDNEKLNEILEPYSSNAIKIAKIQEDNMYKKYGIIPDHIYNFQFSNGSNINGIIMNFDSNTFCIRGVKGMYIVKRSELDSMYPSKMIKNLWEESRVKYLESFIETI